MPRVRFRRAPSAEARPPSFSDSVNSVLDECRAGTKPNVTPVKIETTRVNVRTRQSSPTCSARGMFCFPSATNRSDHHTARNNPSNPPVNESTTLSVNNCRTTRMRLAPSAARMAISLCRDIARASSRLATFAHAIKSTQPTAPNRINKAGRMSPTSASSVGSTPVLLCKFLSGYCCSRRALIEAISAVACSLDTPGLRRAITCM